MILNLIFALGLLVSGLIGFGSWISALKEADVSTLTIAPVAKAFAIPVVWIAVCVLVVVTGFAVTLSAQIDQMVG